MRRTPDSATLPTVAAYDLVIVGGGIVGLSSAREILMRNPRLSLLLLEKEAEVGSHQTGHNSGVIHSGIYYAPGSHRARLCVAGARMMYEYSERHGLSADRCGKLIVATEDSELPRLEELFRRGNANGVRGLEMIGPEEIRDHEPHCVGIRAIWSPETGIADYSAVAATMAAEVRAFGGTIITGTEVNGFSSSSSTVVLSTTAGEYVAKRVLTCAGLYSDRVAKLSGASAEPQVVPFRGDYWELRPDRRALVNNLIYPVPDPSFPFLGVHFTRRITDGAILLGPNAVLAFSREGYRRSDLRPRDLLEALEYRGFRRLARKYWRTGAAEMHRDFSKRAFVASCRRYVPEIQLNDVIPGSSGVRAQALAPDGTLVEDFRFDVQGRQFLHIRNAPSPSATASIAIGQLVADEWEGAA